MEERRERDSYMRIYGLPKNDEVLEYHRSVDSTQRFGFAYMLSKNREWRIYSGRTFDHVYGIYIGVTAFEDEIDRDEEIPEEYSTFVMITVFFLLDQNLRPTEIIDQFRITSENSFDGSDGNRSRIIRDLSPPPVDDEIGPLNFEL